MFAKYKECELLAPGGSPDSIKAASLAGCDAVYVGGSNFSARAFAKNLTDEQLFDIIDYLHLRNQRLYLAINTLIKSFEFKKVYDYAVRMYERGVDAFIVQDIGVMAFLAENLPDIEIHASTQMAVSGSTAINFLQKNFSLRRVVLPRELSLKQISEIAKHTELDLECFGHGALCYSYSGQCLMSSMICQRSGNRGQCAQSCRLPYSYERRPPSYLLSLKELNTIEWLPELIRAGVTSLKLEGRMRSPSYVGAVTSIYRKYLNKAMDAVKHGAEYKVKKEDLNAIETIFHRSGFTDAYLTDRPNAKMISFQTSSASSKEDAAKAVFEQCDRIPALKIRADLTLNVGKPAILELSGIVKGEQVSVCSTSSSILEPAKNKALDYETLQRQLAKSDNDYLILSSLKVTQDNPVFMPISALNQLRREAFEKLKNALLINNGFLPRNPVLKKEEAKETKETQKKDFNRNFGFSAYVQTFEQFEEVVKAPFLSKIYLEADLLLHLNEDELKVKLRELIGKITKNQSLFLALPHLYEEFRSRVPDYFWKMVEESQIFGFLIRNLEELAVLRNNGSQKILITDYMLYAMNEAAMDVLYSSDVSMITLPMELNYRELKHLTHHRKDEEKELVIFGYPIAMVSKNCIKKNHHACNHKSGFTYMIDRKKYRFAIKSNCASCYNVIYNSQKIFLTDLLHEKLKHMDISMFRLDFTDENREETRQILKDTEDYILNSLLKSPDFPYSRGHFNRGIL